MRFQPIGSCWETYQDAVFVPCLRAPFIRCIWTVGIKKNLLSLYPPWGPYGYWKWERACCVRAHSPYHQASWLLLCYSSSIEVPQQCVMQAIFFPRISHCFQTRWQMCSLSFSSSPLQGVPNQHTAPLPAYDAQRAFSSAAVKQNKTYPVSHQSCISILWLFSANSSFSHVKGYFLFNEVAYTSYCLRGTLLQSTYSDVFAEESTKELCGESTPGAGVGKAQLPQC